MAKLKYLVLFFTCCLCWSEVGAVDIVPQPRLLEEKEGKVVFGKKIEVYAGSKNLESVVNTWLETLEKPYPSGYTETASGFRRIVSEATLPEIGLSLKSRNADICLSVDAALDDEEYLLDIAESGISISGGSAIGVQWGLQTLSQLLIACVNVWSAGDTIELPALHIADKPRLEYREALLDCMSYSFSLEEVKSFIDVMLLHKFNVFHWCYLTDKQNGEIPCGNIYTQDQIKEVEEYATARGITVIRETDILKWRKNRSALYSDFGFRGNGCNEVYNYLKRHAVSDSDENVVRRILGVQSKMWCKNIGSYDEVQYLLLPEMAALSEIVWAMELIDYDLFLSRLRHGLIPSYQYFGLIYSPEAFKRASFDESRIRHYELPDILSLTNGGRVGTVRKWEHSRRPELLSVFQRKMYGTLPDIDVCVSSRCVEESSSALDGKATRRQVELTFTRNGIARKVMLLTYLPNIPEKPVPCFLGFNFQGNNTISFDPDVIASQYSVHPVGNKSSRWDIESIIDAGYALVTAHYNDFFFDVEDNDFEGKYRKSMLALFDKTSSADVSMDEGRAISVWAWGYSRILDYLEDEEPRIDASKVIVMGHSRLGKAALWAGANDPRFAMVISNDSGCCGAALSKRRIGEDLHRILRFRHWFCKNFDIYTDNEEALPFDQHELLALIAPRPLYIASAEDDIWADPRGEFLALSEASKVYALYGHDVLDSCIVPVVGKPLYEGLVGYHIREGKHDVTSFDWKCFIDFANKWF